MSQERKYIKIASFVAFALFVLRIVMVCLDLASVGMPTQPYDTACLAWNVASGVTCLVCCVFGIRGANKPSAINPLKPATLVGALLGVVLLVIVFTLGGGFSRDNVVTLVDGVTDVIFFGYYFNLTNKVIAQRDKI